MIRVVIILLILTNTVSCVSMRKFTSTEELCKSLRKDSTQLATIISSQNEKIDVLTRLNISLEQDTLRFFRRYSDLMSNFLQSEEDNKHEILKLNNQLYGTVKSRNNSYDNSGRSSRVTKGAVAISKSISNLGEDMKNALASYNSANYSIDSRNWELSVKLRDTLLFPYIYESGRYTFDYTRLSRDGEAIIRKLALLFIEKDNFDITIRQNVYINTPHLRYIPPINDYEQANLAKKSIERFEIQRVVAKHRDSLSLNGAIVDIDASTRLDSIRHEIELQTIRSADLERQDAINKMKGEAHRRDADRTLVVMRALMNNCFRSLDGSKMSRDVTYVKVNDPTSFNDKDWVEVILKPDIADFFLLIRELEKNK